MRKKKQPLSIFEMAFCLLAVIVGVVACQIHQHQEAKAAEPLPTENPTAVVVIATAEPIVNEEIPIVIAPDPKPEGQAFNIYDVPLEDELQVYIVRLCEEHHIDPAVVMGMAQRESAFDASAMGDNGNSYGLMQIQKRFHSDRMDKFGATDLLDPHQCVTVAVDFLSELLDIYDGDIEKALTAYNQGRYNGIVSDYAKDVIKNSENIKKGMKQVWYSDDPIADFDRKDAADNEALSRLPKCAQCNFEIQEDRLLNIHGELFHINCADDAFGEWTSEHTEQDVWSE